VGNYLEAPALRLHLLGPFQLEADGRVTPVDRWKSKKAVTLLKYLVTQRRRPVSRERLQEILFPEAQDPEQAAHDLHVTVYLLRRALEPDRPRYQDSSYITRTKGFYAFCSDVRCWIDLEEFEECCQRGSRLTDTDSDAAIDAYERALSLYRGDFLPEDEYDDWTTGPRDQYRELYLEATLALANLLINRRSDNLRAARLCRTALRRDPGREELYQVLLRALIQAGHRAEAAFKYRQCVKVLREELGLAPSPETRALLATAAGPAEVDVTETTELIDPEHPGPFVCERHEFVAFLRLELRRQRRGGHGVTLISLEIKEGRAAEQRLPEVIFPVLRQGDVVCQWGARRILVQFPCTDPRASQVIGRRLGRAIKRFPAGSVTVCCRCLLPSAEPAALSLESLF
jgi:DNA-binding SARP family transcriptional activator